MKYEKICEKCGAGFVQIRGKNQAPPRFCSMKCRGHTGFSPGGNFRTSNESPEEKIQRMRNCFEKHVIRNEDCWGWNGSIEKNGYARMSCRDIPARHAHVASFLLFKGNIPKEKQINHLCLKRHCTNPDHLYLGTQTENMKDKILANRQAKGSKNGNSKLTEDCVKKIKNLLSNGEKASVIAKIFSVTPEQIYNISSGSQWKHITE